MMDSILIVAGENSGDAYGANLVKEFKKHHPSCAFFGIGGKQMEAQGVELVATIGELSIMGITGVISGFSRIRELFNRLKREAARRKPAASVLIDSPDFNLRLARRLKKLSIPVLYYISPTVWAWRKGRLKTIKKYTQKMLLIFPFEEEIYHSSGIPFSYVGHPVKERISVRLTREEFFHRYNLEPRKKLIAVLPGSRKSEIAHHLPVLTAAAQKFGAEIPVQFVLILAENFDEQTVRNRIPDGLQDFHILSEDKYEAIASSDVALSAFGTANLEIALLQTPLIAFYRVSRFNNFIFRLYAYITFKKLRYFSIVNILAGRRVVPELVQRNFTQKNILREIKKILESEKIRSRMVAAFNEIADSLGEKRASENAAQELGKLLSTNTAQGV